MDHNINYCCNLLKFRHPSLTDLNESDVVSVNLVHKTKLKSTLLKKN